MFKIRGRLLFNLFGYFSNTKNVCSKQAGGSFLIYLTTFLKRKIVCSKQLGRGGGEGGGMVLNLLPNFQKGSQSDWSLYRLYPCIPFIVTPFAW